MADKISAYGRAGLDISTTRNRGVNRSGRADDTQSGKPASGGGDAVDFSATASNLKRIEAQLKDTPDVDRSRVDALRQKIESGGYQVDADRLAAKLVRLEQDLG
jgi:negative regulator of flagellin synthesis FlgM